MAKEAVKELKAEDVGAEKPKKKSGGKKLLIIILAAVVLLGVGGGIGAYLLLGGGAGSGKEGARAEKEEEKKPPVYHSLEPFTVNLIKGEGEDHYLQVSVDLRLADKTVTDKLKLHMPEIKNGILMLLSSKRAADLSSTEGKEKLAEEILERVNKPLGKPEKGKGGKEGKYVTGVFFTSFVIQ